MAYQMQDRSLGRARAEGGAFEAWLHQNLAKCFDETLAEPLPEQLLALVNEKPH